MVNREYAVAYVASFLMEHGHVPMKEEVFQERLSVCNECEYRQSIKMKIAEDIDVDPETETVNAEWRTDEFDICGHCGCNLEERLSEWTGACPLNKWNFSYDDWVKHYLPLVKREIETYGGTDFYLWEGVLESEDTEENTDGE